MGLLFDVSSLPPHSWVGSPYFSRAVTPEISPFPHYPETLKGLFFHEVLGDRTQTVLTRTRLWVKSFMMGWAKTTPLAHVRWPSLIIDSIES